MPVYPDAGKNIKLIGMEEDTNRGKVKQPTQYGQPISAEEKLQEHMRMWNDTVDKFMKGELKQKEIFIMDTPLVFELLNENGEFSVEAGKPMFANIPIIHKILKGKHSKEINAEMLKQLPEKIADPIMILRNRDENSNLIPREAIAIVDIQDKNDDAVIVPIRLVEENDGYHMKSFFGKQETQSWAVWRISKGDCIITKKKLPSGKSLPGTYCPYLFPSEVLILKVY